MNLPEARLLGEHAAARGNAFAWWRPQRRRQRIKRWGFPPFKRHGEPVGRCDRCGWNGNISS